MPHATLIKFGYPDTLIHEGRHWALLVRPAQVTLGSLVLCSLSEATTYGELPDEAYLEQRQMVAITEAVLKRLVGYERINYLMLMMVDRHVHFHVVPRYCGERQFANCRFPDSGWPGPPDLAASQPAPTTLPEELRRLIVARTME